MARTREPVAERASADEWRARIREWNASGLDAKTFAAQVGVSPRSLSWWKWRLARGEVKTPRPPIERPPSFVPVVLRAVTPAPRGDGGVEVVSARGHVVRVKPHFDEATFLRVVALLERP